MTCADNRSRRPRWRRLFAGLLLALSLGGCEGGDSRALVEAIEVARQGFADLSLTPRDQTLSLGETLQLAASAGLTGGGQTDVTSQVNWSSSNPGAISVDGQGRITALAAGVATISARLAELRAQADFTASDAPLASISISGGSSVRVCDNLALTATGVFTGEESNPRDITRRVIWQSGTPASAAFSTSEAGLLRSFAVDTVAVSASLDSVSSNLDVSITGTIDTLSLSPANQTLNVGDSQQYTATATYADASTASVGGNADWTSSSPTVVSIGNSDDDRGLARALGTGTATIQAECAQQSGTTGVTVDAARTLFALRIQGDETVVLNDGNSLQLEAEAVFSNATTEIVTEDAEWSVVEVLSGVGVSVSNEDGSRGEVTTNGVGRSLVRASFDGETDTVEIDVR